MKKSTISFLCNNAAYSQRALLRGFSVRFYRATAVTEPIQKEMIYDEILDKPDDSQWTVPELINKGFAMLAIDNVKFKYMAKEAFQEAKDKDTGGDYVNEINCGLDQTDSYNLCDKAETNMCQHAFNKT